MVPPGSFGKEVFFPSSFYSSVLELELQVVLL